MQIVNEMSRSKTTCWKETTQIKQRKELFSIDRKVSDK